jgi:hypothetical protein
MSKRRPRTTKPRSKKGMHLETLLRRLGGIEQLREFLGSEHNRRAQLEADAVFVRETEELQEGFEAAYLSKPSTVDSFLNQFRLPSPFHTPKLRRFMDALPSKMSALFKRYVQYSSRSNVYFVRKRNSFEWRLMPEFGWKFRVNQSNGRLEAGAHVPEGSPASDYFEAPNLQIPQAFQTLIDGKEAKFVQIDDVSGASVLDDIENFAYHSDGLTFIVHNAAHPYLFCLVGEKATKALWDKAGKGITAFQRQFGRGKGGRPTTTVGLKKTIREALKQPGRKKEKAVRLMSDIATASGQSYISRVGKSDRERDARIAKLKQQFDSE